MLVFGSAQRRPGRFGRPYTEQWSYTKQEMGTNGRKGIINMFAIGFLTMIATAWTVCAPTKS